MKAGTKSLLFGYHQFLLHPMFVWAAWLRLYGWTWDRRIVTSFFLHDIGYWGLPNMDGEEGKDHPFAGAFWMSKKFDEGYACEWFRFTAFHSRTIAKRFNSKLSRLGYADKLAFELYPIWLIRLLGWLSGENAEYMGISTTDSTTPLAKPLPFNEWIVKAKKANIDTLKEAGLCD